MQKLLRTPLVGEFYHNADSSVDVYPILGLAGISEGAHQNISIFMICNAPIIPLVKSIVFQSMRARDICGRGVTQTISNSTHHYSWVTKAWLTQMDIKWRGHYGNGDWSTNPKFSNVSDLPPFFKKFGGSVYRTGYEKVGVYLNDECCPAKLLYKIIS